MLGPGGGLRELSLPVTQEPQPRTEQKQEIQAEARAVLKAAPGIAVLDTREDGGYMTPLECQGEDETDQHGSAARTARDEHIDESPKPLRSPGGHKKIQSGP